MRSSPLKGSNISTVRSINEKLILHLLRRHGRLSKAEATRVTGLSANAISVIFRALEKEGLLLRGSPIRGRVGQPSTPMMLNPDARYYIGFKIGRRTYDIALVDFLGEIRARKTQRHTYPTPDSATQFITESLPEILATAGVSEERIGAFNIATPFELWSWTSDFDAPGPVMEAWRDYDLESEIRRLVPWPVTVENDGTAACRAELVFGPTPDAHDSIYLFVGTFIGGGVVLNGSVFSGRRGNSGGFGPLRIPDQPGGDRLVDHASLVVLEHMVAQRDAALGSSVYSVDGDWSLFEPELSTWLARAGRSLGHAIVSALAVIDFEAVVIDGAFPPAIRSRLVGEVEAQLDRLDLQGVVRPDIKAGHFGYIARVLGAAAYQISTEYMIDRNTLLGEAPTTLFEP
jgi:predicted NBD/HSP70 family sugar kinase